MLFTGGTVGSLQASEKWVLSGVQAGHEQEGCDTSAQESEHQSFVKRL